MVRDDLQLVLQQQKSVTQLYSFASSTAEVFLEVIQPPASLVIFGAGFDVLTVVHFAKQAASLKLIEIAIADSQSPLHNYAVEQITSEQGRIFVAESPSISETYQEVLQRHNLPFI